MSTPNYGPMQPFMEKIRRLRDMGSNAVDSISRPFTAAQNAMKPTDPHQQAIDQINKQAMDKSVQDANASHVAAQQQLTNMKKPLGK